MRAGSDPKRAGRGRLAIWLGAGLVAVSLGGGGGVLWLSSGSPRQSIAAEPASAAADPVLVPRRRHPPQVVEPVAGVVGGQTAEEQLHIDTRPATQGGGEVKPPSDAEVKRELAVLEKQDQTYHFDQLDFSQQLLDPSTLGPGGFRRSIASVYYDYGGGLACGGTLKPEQLGVAHKTLPCGTRVTFRYGGKAIRVPVIDRGPYIAGREWDFTGATAAALGFPGLGVVEWRIG
jgi:hypothetical protein